MGPGLLWGSVGRGTHAPPKRTLREQARLPALGQWLIRVSLTSTTPEAGPFLRLVKPSLSPLLSYSPSWHAHVNALFPLLGLGLGFL